jgi:beta-lactamase class A
VTEIGRPRFFPRLILLAVLLSGSVGALPRNAGAAELAAPATVAGGQLAWLLGALNGDGSALSKTSLKQHFTKDFLTALPADQLLNVLVGYVKPNAPLNIARFAGSPDRNELHAILTTSAGDWSVILGVETGGAGRINALFFEPVFVPAPAKPVASWSDLLARFKKIAPRTSLTVAEVTDNQCTQLQSLNPDAELAIGSSFKLYVLGEIARQIDAGKLSWDQPITIRDDLRSLPNGDLRLAPAGAQYPLWFFVEQMISQSDNTATDHLIHLLGRTTIEAMMVTMGHADPALNAPLLLTREWFAIKLRWNAKEIASYLASTPAEKRVLLRTTAETDADTLGQDEQWPNSYLIDSIEWFASSADLCRAMAYLHGQAQKPGLTEIADAFSIYSGIDFDAKTWKYIGFKGGYETGVKSDVWLLERADGRWFVVSAIINDPKKEIDGVSMHQLIAAAVSLLATA